jgi:septal ring factor EnvC (AmiA/AmiB activator)
VLEKGAAFPEGDSGEPSRLRQILLAHNNQLEQSLQRLSKLNTQLASVKEEHEQVSRELDRLPRQADMEARLRELNRQLDDLRDEIRKVCLVKVQAALIPPSLSAFQRYSALQHGAGSSAAATGICSAGDSERIDYLLPDTLV